MKMAKKEKYVMAGTDEEVLLGDVISQKLVKELEKEPCEDVIGFSNFVANELRKIADLFASCRTDLSPEQEQAGFGNLNFGMFGVLDWYCKRMGITDHAEVEKVPWVRVYKCMDMDAQTRRCEQRLSEIQSNKLKRR